MACKVVITDEAARSRDDIIAYLVTVLHEPKAAGRFLDELDALADRLTAFPEAYPVSAEPRLADLAYRKACVMRYIVLYKVQEDVVYITNIFHETQDYAKLV